MVRSKYFIEFIEEEDRPSRSEARTTGFPSACPLLSQQSPKKPEPPTPAPSPSQAVIDAWNDGGKLIEMTEDKYDHKITPLQRTFAEVLLHFIGASYVLKTQPTARSHAPHDLSRSDYKSKADVIVALRMAKPIR